MVDFFNSNMVGIKLSRVNLFKKWANQKVFTCWLTLELPLYNDIDERYYEKWKGCHC